MRRAWVLALLPALASAETFEDLRDRAMEVSDPRPAVQPSLWRCTDSEPFRLRRCRLLKRRLMAQRAAQTYWMRAEPEAVRVIARDRPEPKAEVVLEGCLTCGRPVALEGGLVGSGFVTTRRPRAVRPRAGAPGFFDLFNLDEERLPVTVDGQKPSVWKETVGPHLRAEVVFRPTMDPPWWYGIQPRHEGVTVKIVGYRIFDRCTGRIVASSLPSEPVEGVEKTESTCPGYVAPVVEAPEPPPEDLPQKLNRDQIQRAFESVREDVLVCYERNGVPGYAPARVVIMGSDGKVKSVAIGGKFEGSPTAECITKAVMGLVFPRFLDDEMVVNWQFFLR